MKDRRGFLVDVAAASVAAAFSSLLPARSAFGAGDSASLTLYPSRIVTKMPRDFVGLSYESSQLGDPDFFSPKNSGLIALCKLLSPNGVLRTGGNSSEFTWWKASADAAEPALQHAPGTTDANWMPHELVAITPAAIDNLAGFLDAAGWKLIYGLNLGSGTPDRAAEEAAYVARVMGPRLLYLQIGNEPDLYHRTSNGLRPPTYSFSDYLAEWIPFADAITARVPGAALGAPDANGIKEWALLFAQQAPQKTKDRIVALSSHYYAEGPPEDPTMTIERLLRRDPRLEQDIPPVIDAARANNWPYRMTEGNSCFRGGKPNMSDAFASALWGADYMLFLAHAGCVGVNLHGGGAKQIRAALGGHLPGESVATRPDAAASGSFYTPIAGDATQGFSARPIFYGMMLANYFAGANIVANDFDPQGANAVAYAANTSDGITVAVLNKDATHDLQIEVGIDRSAPGTLTAPGPQTRMKHARIWRLSGSALDATSGVTLGGAQVAADGKWSATKEERVALGGKPLVRDLPHASSESFILDVPRASGALVLLS
jgi:hypothetical protein